MFVICLFLKQILSKINLFTSMYRYFKNKTGISESIKV